MRNRWDEKKASGLETDLAMRAYSSRLIGEDKALVLHGGGNTSVKSSTVDRFGDELEIIWVKASGFDLGAMGEEGFTALSLPHLLRLAKLESLSDSDMVNEVRRARLDSSAAAASIEAIVHAIIPFKYVDHSHADAVLTISNTPEGATLLSEIYGDKVLILPYVKPGFDLAVQLKPYIASGRLQAADAVILEHHGVFTYADNARDSYERMVDIATRAGNWLERRYGSVEITGEPITDPVLVARTRRIASDIAGQPLISRQGAMLPYGRVDEFAAMLRKGTLTPEHVIHNKPFPAVVADDPQLAMQNFEADYRDYFDRATDGTLTMLPPYPHWVLFADGSSRSFGPNLKRAMISSDVSFATVRALSYASKIGDWRGLSEAELRDLEYWELEQAKLKSQKPALELTGKVAVVSGAAAGIGKACAEVLAEKGAVVVGLDIDPAILQRMDRPGFDSVVIDLVEEAAVKAALAEIVDRYGGIDILISNAGIFRTGARIETLADDDWDAAMAVNMTSHRKLLKHSIPYLRHGVDPAVVFVGSRNVLAPGAGAAAYSVSKAGLTQLARVAALELAEEGITVNVIHPDAVFDTNLWTKEALETSAKRYGLTVEQYKTRNLMKTEITSADVGRAAAAFVDGTLRRTTGAQLPVDGGNERVI